MSQFETIMLESGPNGIVRLTLNRPDARNAMSQQMIRDLRTASDQIAGDGKIRAVVLTGAGDVFCAGGDLKGMKAQATRTRPERIHDARQFAETLSLLDRLPKPVIGRINGSAYGGGLGLISICDIAIGTTTARFQLSEVTLGLIPATISPYVVARMGVPNARRVMLNALRMDGAEAARLGLLSAAVAPDDLDGAIDREVALCLQCAPGAVAAAKRLIEFVSTHDVDENIRYTADRLADCWESAELAEGIAGFLEKRKPNWHVAAE